MLTVLLSFTFFWIAMETETHIGKRIKSARDKLGLSIIDIGNHLEITPQAVHFWEVGQTVPRGKRINDLAKLLKVSPHWLQFGEGKQDATPDINGQKVLDSQQFETICRDALAKTLITCGQLGWITLKEETPLDVILDVGLLEFKKQNLDINEIIKEEEGD